MVRAETGQALSTPGVEGRADYVPAWPPSPQGHTQPLPTWARPHLAEHPQTEQALLLGCHHKVVSVVLVVHDVFQINAWGGGEVQDMCLLLLYVASPNTGARPDLFDYSGCP